MLIQNNSGHLSGTLFITSGSLWFFAGIIEWFSSFLDQIGRIVYSTIETVMVITATVLTMIA